MTGKANGKNGFAQVAKIFGNKFLGRFLDACKHNKFLSFGSVGERQPGEATVDGTDMVGLRNNEVRGKRNKQNKYSR